MASALSSQIQSTAGAIPVLNEKGEISMQKVKVHRYISGRRPKYAPEESSEGESEDEFPFERRLGEGVSITTTSMVTGSNAAAVSSRGPQVEGEEPMEVAHEPSEAEKLDPRLRRLQKREYEDADEKYERHRHIHEPEIISTGAAEDDVEEEKEDEDEEEGERPARHRWNREQEDTSDEDEELDDQAFEHRRALLRQKAQDKATQEEILVMEEEEGKSEESESSEYEEYTDSEEEEMGQRLKPVFVRKKDRITVQEREERLQKDKELEAEAKKMAEERRRQTLKIVEHETRKEIMESKKQTGGGNANDPSELVITDDENDEAAYEAWKLRELKRIKRDKDEKENYEKDRMEVDRLHNLTEEERRAEQRLNPRQVTNKAAKGKYKFLQKYYHRGAFYLDEEENVLRRDFSSPTLEDHFNKTILPKVMQVKNFGRSGRTKYTHLVDQDTTVFDSPWMSETANNLKFHTNQAGGMKQVFDRPTLQKRKKTS